MKFHLLSFFMLLPILGTAQQARQHTVIQKTATRKYELKQYYFVMLTKGPNRQETDTAALNKLQEAHLANIEKLANEGKILVAGPFGDDGNWRGIFIFNCQTEEETR